MRHSKLHLAIIGGCGLAMASALAVADRGRGSIRAASPPPRVIVHEEPAHRDDHPVHEEPVHAEPAHAEVRHDWDDNDEDARHYGGFARGVAVHVLRGERVHALPPHFVRLAFNHHDYFLDDVGAYYDLQPDGEYLVIQPPVGVVVAGLPAGSVPIVVGPTTYYYLDGVFYVSSGGAFAVVNPPPGIVVPSLPAGASQTVINGTVVYQFNGFNYQPSLQDGVTVYTVIPG